MKTLIEFIMYPILGVVVYSVLFMISQKINDLHQIAIDKRNEKIRPMLDVRGHPLSDRTEDFDQAQTEYNRDFKTVEWMSGTTIIVFLVLFVIVGGFFISIIK